MNKEELKELLKEHLTIEISKEFEYYKEEPDIQITVYFDDEEIYQSRT